MWIRAKNNQLEYRNWVNSLYIALLWFLPLFLIGWNLWKKINIAYEINKFSSIIFISYCVVGILTFLSANFVYALIDDTWETTLADGNYRVGFSTGSKSEYYYTEPVNIFSRRRFEWTVEKYAESLSKVYHAKFQYMGDDDGNPQFISPEYEDITVTVYGVDDSGENALDEDFCFMVTSSRLKQEWDTFFTNGEECVLYYQDYYYKSAQRNPVYAVVVYRDRIEETAKDLAAFIKNECETAVRTDGEPLYANMNGSIYLLFKEYEESDYIGTRNIPYGEKNSSWIYDASVKGDDILSELESEF